jgi:hypothetical protein
MKFDGRLMFLWKKVLESRPSVLASVLSRFHPVSSGVGCQAQQRRARHIEAARDLCAGCQALPQTLADGDNGRHAHAEFDCLGILSDEWKRRGW